MKKGNITIDELLHILSNDDLCKQLLEEDNSSPFLGGTHTKQQYWKEFSRLLNSTVYIMKQTHNFHYLPLAMKILNRLYLEQMKENPFLFYENSACRNLLNLQKQYPQELENFRKFLIAINFENAQDDVGRFYHQQMKKNRILNDFELKDLLNYLMIFKNRKMPHHYLRYLFYVIFEKDHHLELKSSIYAELFRFLILDLLDQLGWKESVHVVSLQEKKPFIYQGPDIYINLEMMKPTLEGNLSYFPYLFDLFEKRYKYKSFVHNKYEEIKSKKQYTIKEILGSSYFYENFSYISVEREIVDQSLIERLRFFEDVAPSLYQQIVQDYECQILQTIKLVTPSKEPIHLVLSLDDLLEQTILLTPEVIQNQPYLQLEYQEDGRRKRTIQLLKEYEIELELFLETGEQTHKALADYYRKTILTTSLNMSNFIEEFVEVLHYSVKNTQTEKLIEEIFCKYFVEQLNENLQNHILTYSELEVILSKCNQYMLKFYEVEQSKITKYLSKDQSKWQKLNNHLNYLYHSVEYMSRSEHYENTSLQLTQVIELDGAKEIQKKVLKRKLIKSRIYMVILVILILIFSVSLFLLGRILVQYWSAKDSYGKIQQQVNQTKPVETFTPDPNRTEFPINDSIPQLDFIPLKEQNEEVIAWVRVDDTQINYPVVQGENNEFYLSHLYNKKYNISGSIFGDYRNNKDFSSQNTVLYGHNMRNGTMFGGLKKYKEEGYLDAHKYIWLITPKATYQYEVYAAYELNSLKEQYTFNFSSEESFQQYLDEIKTKSILSNNVEVTSKDHILTLSTCVEEDSVKRFVVVAKRMITYVIPNQEVSN